MALDILGTLNHPVGKRHGVMPTGLWELSSAESRCRSAIWPTRLLAEFTLVKD